MVFIYSLILISDILEDKLFKIIQLPKPFTSLYYYLFPLKNLSHLNDKDLYKLMISNKYTFYSVFFYLKNNSPEKINKMWFIASDFGHTEVQILLKKLNKNSENITN